MSQCPKLKINHKCLRCGHQWASVKARPAVCQKCLSYSWDMPEFKRGDGDRHKIPHQCLRCGHEWRDLKAKPYGCPECRSHYWDKAKLPEIGRFKGVMTPEEADAFRENRAAGVEARKVVRQREARKGLAYRGGALWRSRANGGRPHIADEGEAE